MRGTGGGGADGRGAIGEALADTTGGAAASGTGDEGAVARVGGADASADATGDDGTGDETDGGATTARAGVTAAGDALTEAGTAGFASGGATVLGRLTTAGGAVAGFSIGACDTGGAAGRGAAGGATASFRCVIAFNTSPGREMCDRSIFVLISSSPRAPRELDLPAEDEPSAEERM